MCECVYECVCVSMCMCRGRRGAPWMLTLRVSAALAVAQPRSHPGCNKCTDQEHRHHFTGCFIHSGHSLAQSASLLPCLFESICSAFGKERLKISVMPTSFNFLLKKLQNIYFTATTLTTMYELAEMKSHFFFICLYYNNLFNISSIYMKRAEKDDVLKYICLTLGLNQTK